jgi:hypothetical protein
MMGTLDWNETTVIVDHCGLKVPTTATNGPLQVLEYSSKLTTERCVDMGVANIRGSSSNL